MCTEFLIDELSREKSLKLASLKRSNCIFVEKLKVVIKQMKIIPNTYILQSTRVHHICSGENRKRIIEIWQIIESNTKK